MEWAISFDEWPGFAVVRTHGTFNAPDHARMVADIVSQKGWRPGHPILFDNRDLSFDEAYYEDMRRARENHAEHESEIQDARSAILVRPVDYGVLRQFQLLADGTVSAQVRIFEDEKAARAWLSAPSQEHAATSSTVSKPKV